MEVILVFIGVAVAALIIGITKSASSSSRQAISKLNAQVSHLNTKQKIAVLKSQQERIELMKLYRKEVASRERQGMGKMSFEDWLAFKDLARYMQNIGDDNSSQN